jgi:hypothetical protein
MILGTGCSAVEPAEYPQASTEDEAPPWQQEDVVDRRDLATTLSLRTDGGAVVVRVGDAEIVGSDVSLGRFAEAEGTAIRGRAFGRPVNLDATDGRVAGLFGGRPVDLSVARHGGALHVEGLSRGEPTSFVLGPRVLQGRVGRCSYELQRRGELGYEGRRSCGGPTERVTLRIPTMLACWSDEARAASLAILLGGT